jgi:Zn-dependent peptidase ImmA (M78 family)
MKAENSSMLIERFRRRLPGFNVRRFCLRDLYDLCSYRGIDIIQMPLRALHGAAAEEDGYQYIFINSLLQNTEKIVAGFHEFCHLTDHVLDVDVFHFTGSLWNVNKYERQANIIGVLALMPAPSIQGMTVEDIMRQFGVRREIAEFRASLMI